VDQRLIYLSYADVVSVGMGMPDVIRVLEAAFREKGEGRVEMPPKPGIHPGGGDNFIHAMPAYIPAMRSAGVKWVSGFPENHRRGLPYISGLLILNDPESGLPTCVMDCQWITAMRTAGASAVSARILARPESSVLGVLGCGVQGRANAEALSTLFALREVRAYDVEPGAAQAFSQKVSAALDLDVRVVSTPREAVTGCDLIVTAGPFLRIPHATIQPGWMDEGAFASLVDVDSYWHPDALKQADKFCTDDVPQLRHFQSLGYLQDIPPIHADLGELVTGQKPGRQAAQERTMACNLGLALGDVAVASAVYRQAVEKNIGTWLPL
jgi:ornithine cyclodeaminase/alanine dehydrogenase-like protein (mu-crystallin family)